MEDTGRLETVPHSTQFIWNRLASEVEPQRSFPPLIIKLSDATDDNGTLVIPVPVILGVGPAQEHYRLLFKIQQTEPRRGCKLCMLGIISQTNVRFRTRSRQDTRLRLTRWRRLERISGIRSFHSPGYRRLLSQPIPQEIVYYLCIRVV